MSGNPKTALITGITGQDGHYLALHLLSLGYTVHGLARRRASEARIGAALFESDRLVIRAGDITDASVVMNAVRDSQPGELYNCAGQSHIGYSWSCPEETIRVNTLGPLNVLEAVRFACPHCRVYLAGSVEFLDQGDPPLTERTRLRASSPYAAAKAAAFEMGRLYRERYGLHVSTAILGNHTSLRRPEAFVTKKITAGIARIARGEADKLTLGDINVPLDIGWAPDYVKAFHRMLQQPSGGDYIVATGEQHTLKEFIGQAWWVASGNRYEYVPVQVDPSLIRPGAVRPGRLDITKIRGIGWEPETSYASMVEQLMQAELAGKV